ncbi:hypothetical protein R9C00_26805 [Flammeovirgaceae bacterium SG7u.111]|nr:hypothetical protein [Flammeovirgaceae bacterium SG7u.132]WPO35310.1 hypothetical protein R9C00_26805 [Flammeovirgaceae bacterium SG7u.111]
MKIRYSLLSGFFFALSTVLLQAQNLIPNYSFENSDLVPEAEAEAHNLEGWEVLTQKGDDFHYAIPDYLRVDGKNKAKVSEAYFGKIEPFEGKGMVGLMAYNQVIRGFREYLSIRLNSPLDTNQTYRLIAHLANGNKHYGRLGTYFGFYFSEELPSQNGHDAMDVTPQLETTDVIFSEKWQKHLFSFKPDKPYEYLTIGNFRTDENAAPKVFSEDGNSCAYYLVDALILEPIKLPKAKRTEQSTEDSLKNVASELLATISAEKLGGRPVLKQQVIEVEGDILEVKIWDDREVDDDMVSLYLNGKWVVENYTLGKKKLQLELPLKKGNNNYLILYAPSMGNKPPNTAALSYRDKDGKVKKLLLKSDLQSCGAIQIICKS